MPVADAYITVRGSLSPFAICNFIDTENRRLLLECKLDPVHEISTYLPILNFAIIISSVSFCKSRTALGV